MSDAPTPTELATAIGAARDRLLDTVARCPDERWRGALSQADPRPIGVVVDHVADAYGYIGGFIEQLVAGEPVAVSSDLVDALNAAHLDTARDVTRAQAVDHLQSGSAAVMALVAGIAPDVVSGGDPRIARLASIAASHADNHRTEIEVALGLSGAEA